LSFCTSIFTHFAKNINIFYTTAFILRINYIIFFYIFLIKSFCPGNSIFSHIEATNTEEFNKSKIKQKNKCPSVKIRDNPCKSVAKKIKMRITGRPV